VSPLKNDRIKRSALGNLTNAVINTETDDNLKKSALNLVAKKDEAKKFNNVSFQIVLVLL